MTSFKSHCHFLSIILQLFFRYCGFFHFCHFSAKIFFLRFCMRVFNTGVFYLKVFLSCLYPYCLAEKSNSVCYRTVSFQIVVRRCFRNNYTSPNNEANGGRNFDTGRSVVIAKAPTNDNLE